MADPAPYQVLARKYRPRRFDEVVGQDSVVSTLRNAIERGRLHHAYLFSGTRGVGKTTLARLLARALNCAKGPTAEPCGKCDPCREIAAGASLDVIEIDGASNRKVEDVDPLREAARYAPARDRHKIFIIDEVHMLSETAFNALLKVLEEPPPRTMFLFATTEPEEVPDTILSRCLHLACRRVGRQEIAAALSRTAAAEGIEATPEAFDRIAQLADGSVRDGLSLLDQVIAFSGGQVTSEAVGSALGLIDRGIVRDLLEAIRDKDAAGALRVIERLYEAGGDPTHFSREALSLARDALVCHAAGAAGAAALGVPQDEATRCEELASGFSREGLLRLTQALLDMADRIRREEHPRFLLETSALKMILLADMTPIEELLRRLEGEGATASRRAPGSSSPPAGTGPAPRPAQRASGRDPGMLPFVAPASAQALPDPPLSAAPQAPEGSPPGAPSVPDTPNGTGHSPLASRILERVAGRKLSLATFLGQARDLDLEGDVLVVTLLEKQAFVKGSLESAENLAVIREEAGAELGRPVSVTVRLAAPPSDDLARVADQESPVSDTARKRERLMSEALQEPVVRVAMDMFKGRIVDIREAR